jgi:serine/threonine-protein kinase RsbW
MEPQEVQGTGDKTGLLIKLPAKSENVTVVRHAVAGLAERMGMGETGLGDLKTVVTEACMNVVVHAYDDEPGPLEVEAFAEDDGLTVVVRDFGAGIRPSPDIERPSLRIGLTLIAALSSSFEISGGLERGTEIRMHLPVGADPVARASSPGLSFDGKEGAELRIGDPELVAPVLGRVLGALAARHRITVDRLSDAVLLTDAISELAPVAFSDGSVSMNVADRTEGIDLRIGPMPQAATAKLRAGLTLPGIDASLEDLADDLQVEENDAGSYLFVHFAALGE